MKFSVFGEQTRKLFDTFLHPDEDEDAESRRRPTPKQRHLILQRTASSRMSGGKSNRRNVSMLIWSDNYYNS